MHGYKQMKCKGFSYLLTSNTVDPELDLGEGTLSYGPSDLVLGEYFLCYCHVGGLAVPQV